MLHHYELDVPATGSRALGADTPRYACCHRTEDQGHAEHCTEAFRRAYVERSLTEMGISFQCVEAENPVSPSLEVAANILDLAILCAENGNWTAVARLQDARKAVGSAMRERDVLKTEVNALLARQGSVDGRVSHLLDEANAELVSLKTQRDNYKRWAAERYDRLVKIEEAMEGYDE